MKIKINNQFKEIDQSVTVLALLKELFPTIQNYGVAVAINQQIIEKSVWETLFLQENDEIMLIKATQGG